MVIVGTTITGNNRNIALLRFMSDGSPDLAFGIDGVAAIDSGGWDFGRAVAVLSDGRIIVAGTTITGDSRNVALARYMPDGALYTTFGANGVVTTDLGGWDTAQAIALVPTAASSSPGPATMISRWCATGCGTEPSSMTTAVLMSLPSRTWQGVASYRHAMPD